MAEGLVGGEGFAVDASLIKADANRQRGVPGEEVCSTGDKRRAAPCDEYLAALDAADEVRTPPNRSRRRIQRQSGPRRHKGLAFFAYSTNYLIDLDDAVIVDVEVLELAEISRSTGREAT